MNILTWIQENIDSIVFIITSLVTAASAITALTPTPKDDGILKSIKDFLHVIALNVGSSKPK
jgi:hypothetical protein